MKRFFHENPTIAFGLGLPLILVIIFLLVSGIPRLIVADPEYDLLFATEHYNYQNGVQISVINGAVQVVDQGGRPHNQRPRIWRYRADTGAVQEIAFLLPPRPTTNNNSDTPPQQTLIDLPDLEGVKVDSSSIAPDGYEFSIGDRRSRNIFGGLFYSSRYYNNAILSKNGRSVRLPEINGRYYRGNTHFIGWVVSP